MNNSESTVNKNWFALYTKPRHEFKAALQLESVKVNFYLPVVTKIRQWSDRKKKITEPLFGGYIFIHGNEKERLTALEQPAIVRTICFNGRPAVIPDWQIESLKRMLESKREVTVSNQLQVGARIKVTSGPFKDVEGVVYISNKHEKMLAITIELINRSVIVHLPPESVTKQVDN